MNPSPNLFLVGPMGAGKSSIGARLAQHFGATLVDLDAAIEARTGTRIATIFELEGESGFRGRESALLAELSAHQDIVLATGGGAVLSAANRALLHARGFVVWLQASVDQQLQRLAHDRQRPLLETPNRRARLEHLADERDPLYGEVADLSVSTANESCQRSAERIALLLESRWQRVKDTVVPAC